MSVVERTPAQDLAASIRGEEFQSQVQMVLPTDVSKERFVRAAATALLQNPDIATCEIDSIFQSLLRAAQDGLLPDGREAALVKFGSKAQYLPMIGGFRKIAAEFGWTIRTNVVYENDEFDYELGSEPRIVHHPVRPGEERGPLVAAYAVGSHGDGRREIEVMNRAEIEKVRNVSKAKGSGPWRDWEERMWEKTPGRRLFAKLPLGDLERVRRVVSADVDPDQAARMLYGPGTVVDRETGEITQVSGGATVGSAADGSGGLQPERQQAGAGKDEDKSLAAAPAPGTPSTAGDAQPEGAPAAAEQASEADASSSTSPEEPAASDDDPPQPPAPAEAGMLESALAVVIPKRAKNGKEDLRYHGKTLGDVDDDLWFAWVLDLAVERWDPVFRAAVVMVVENRRAAA